MATDPDLARLFHEGMTASNAMFAELVRVIDFSGADTVVDVAGGNGELLARVLSARRPTRVWNSPPPTHFAWTLTSSGREPSNADGDAEGPQGTVRSDQVERPGQFGRNPVETTA